MLIALYKKISYQNGIIPNIKHKIFVFRYHGWSGIELGTILTVPGFFICFFFKPKNDPISTRGDEQHNHNRSKVTIVLKCTAPDEPSKNKKIFIMKKTENASVGYKSAVSIAFFNHSASLNIL